MVVATLEKLKLPYEFKVVDLMKGENKTPEYLKVDCTAFIQSYDIE